jgi:hypothetical protein
MARTVRERVKLAFKSRKRPLSDERLHNHPLLRRELGSTVRTRRKEWLNQGKLAFIGLGLNSRGRAVSLFRWVGR